MKFSNEVAQAAGKVTFIVVDCDGVLTDGRLYFDRDGESIKVFHVQDGQGIVSWLEAGFGCAVISARSSDMLLRRAQELRIRHLVQNAKDKAAEIRSLAGELDIPLGRIAYIGDDIGDIPAMDLVGFPVAVSNAVSAVKSCASYITSLKGGHGAVREVTDLLFTVRDLASENKA